MQRRCERRLLGRSAAIAASGPTTAGEAPLGGAVASATGSAPGEKREGRQRGALKLESAGIGRPDSDPDSYDVEESARGLLTA
jgi:hypothetical protein